MTKDAAQQQAGLSREQARRIAGQLVMIRMPGTALDGDAAEFLRANHIRAICLFRQNMQDERQLSRFTSDLRAAMGSEALIALDQEGGAVVRSTWLPQPPAAMALGAADDGELCYQVGAAVARGVKSLGFNWNFAPVLDLNNNVDNPVIAERSFGSDPGRAAELALAWMQGSLSEGVACCVKHFPGHGDTNMDSHRDLPSVDKPRAALDALELSPFRQAAAQAPAFMTAHIVYPQLDPDYPATMSKRILQGILRDEWGYDGVVITDGMDMHAIAGHFGVGGAAVLALQAGADMVMALGTRATQTETLEALTEAILDGRLDARELQRKLDRVRRLVQAYPCAPQAYATEAADRALMAEAWQRGLTAYRQPVPPAPGAKLRLVISADVASDGVSEAGVPAAKVAALLARNFEVETVTFQKPDDFDWTSLPRDGRYTVLASTMRLRYGESVRRGWRPDLHLALWNPFQCLDVEAPALLAYGFADPALEAVSTWLAGALQAQGSLPVADFDRAAKGSAAQGSAASGSRA